MRKIVFALLLSSLPCVASATCAQIYAGITAAFPDHSEDRSGYITGFSDVGGFTRYTYVASGEAVVIQDRNIVREIMYPYSHCEIAIDYNADPIFQGDFDD
jgi:hypothetical protein